MKLLSTSALTLALVILTVPALAQQDGKSDRRSLEEIVVTAAYREQGLSDVPVSVSAVAGDALIETAVQKAEDLQFLVPNFNVTETGISTNVFIRGIGSGINQAFEQSVGTYIDGVSFGRAQMFRSPFLDLERVEVLRGPQSILFGKNSVAGALNISTAKPTDQFEGRVLVSQEFEDDETIVEGVLSGPFSDRVRGRVAVRYRDALGYVENATTNSDEPARDDLTIRGTLVMDVTDDLTATLKLESSEFDVYGRQIEIINEQPATAGPFTGLQYNQILQIGFGADPSVGNVTQDYVRSSNGDFSFNDSTSAVLTLDWTLGEHTLQSITAFTDFEYDELCDCDFTGANVFKAALQEKYEQFSQEIRLTSPLGDKVDYIVGLYFQTSEHDFNDQILVPANSVLVPAVNARSPGAGSLIANTQAARIASVDNDIISAFAQMSLHVTEGFTLQLGGRVTDDQRDGSRTLTIEALGGAPLPAPQVAAPLVYANPAIFGITSTNLSALGPTGAALIGLLGELPVSGSRSTTKFSPEIKGIWDLSDDAMVYASWASGFKSGSYDFRANNRSFYRTMEDSFEFDDEEASSFELGTKLVLADGRAELNVALFATSYEELQISIFDGVLGFNVGNAAEASINGIEFDGRVAAGEYLTISGGIAFTDFEFVDFRNGQCYFGQTPNVDIDNDGTRELCDYTGNSNQMLSDVQGNLTFDFEYPLSNSMDLGIRLDMFHTGKYDASATYDPALVQDAYTKTDLRVALRTDSWEVAVLGKNLSDEQVLFFGGDTPLAGSSFGVKSNYSFFGQGRTVSLQASYNF
ncbi:MAG: TonB-dependent receptor [Woeseiaceae bacterium]|nr:TonB-dependent receptor [Woeseiaceae bacterium]